jgi:hypothetical protein
MLLIQLHEEDLQLLSWNGSLLGCIWQLRDCITAEYGMQVATMGDWPWNHAADMR